MTSALASTAVSQRRWRLSTAALVLDVGVRRPLQTYRGSSRFLADVTRMDGGLVVAGGADGMLRFWDRDSGYLLWALPAHRSKIYGVHAEGDNLVIRGITGELTRWTLPAPHQVTEACGDHERCAILTR
ncbi:MAG TPA: hypothetical protein VF516_02760 [Kofleriaceae bacterium]